MRMTNVPDLARENRKKAKRERNREKKWEGVCRPPQSRQSRDSSPRGGSRKGEKLEAGALGDTCVVCGEPVPEGRQVCWMCERKEEKHETD